MRRLTGVAAVLVLAMGLAACGDDDDDAGEAATSTTAAAAEFAEYCEESLALETVAEPDIDFESLSEAELAAELKKFATEDLKPLADRLRDSVPAAIASDAQVLFAALDKIVATGDGGAFDTPEVQAAGARVHDFDLANCGWGSADVTAADYAFQGLPATFEAGPTSFDLTNAGQELHELVILKKKDGVTESYDEILALDQEEGQSKVDRVGTAFVAQGDTDYVVADLEAGDYLVACFIPVGLTSEDTAPPENSPPHFTRGMKAEFKVT